MSPVSKIPPSPPNPSIAMSGMMNSSASIAQIIPLGRSYPPNPRLTYSIMPVDELYSRQWNVMPWEDILIVDYPYLAVSQFSITYFSAVAIQEGDTATLSVPDTNNNSIIASAEVVSIGLPITFGVKKLYLARITFYVGSLNSPDVILNIPKALIFPEGKTEFRLRFNTDPVSEDPSLLKNE